MGDEIIFGTGEIVSSSNFIADKVYLIKSGNARLITKINGKSISVLKLSEGNTIGIASLLGGKPIEEVRASEELVVYSLEDNKFLEIYKKNLEVRNFCDIIFGTQKYYLFSKNFQK